eukprot:scaffold67009_cov42-Attheya_sp.AAC.1
MEEQNDSEYHVINYHYCNGKVRTEGHLGGAIEGHFNEFGVESLFRGEFAFQLFAGARLVGKAGGGHGGKVHATLSKRTVKCDCFGGGPMVGSILFLRVGKGGRDKAML